MNLQEELGYRLGDPNVVQRMMQAVAASRPGSWVFQRTLYAIDRFLYRLSGGRLTATGPLSGLPIIMVTTTGARTGAKRTMPVLAVPIGDTLALIGANYGQSPTPGWVHNLEANPEATVEHRGRLAVVVARAVEADEAEAVWEQAVAVYPGCGRYRERARHRPIRVFVLDAARTWDGGRKPETLDGVTDRPPSRTEAPSVPAVPGPEA